MRQDFHFWIYKSKHFLYQKIPFQNSLSWFLIHASPFLFPVILAIIFKIIIIILYFTAPVALFLFSFFLSLKNPSHCRSQLGNKTVYVRSAP